MSKKPIKVYVRSGCLTCKKAVDYLKGKGASLDIVDFFKERLKAEQIRSFLKMAGVSPQAALRKRDRMYKELGLDKKKLSDDELVKLMEKHPGLILRPIIVNGQRAVIADKPEKASAIL